MLLFVFLLEEEGGGGIVLCGGYWRFSVEKRKNFFLRETDIFSQSIVFFFVQHLFFFVQHFQLRESYCKKRYFN